MPEQNQDELTVRQLIISIQGGFRYLRSKWIPILLGGMIFGLIGFGIASYAKPVYTATLTFALEDDKGGGGLSGAAGLASQFGFDIGGSSGGAFSGANLIELMKSRTIVENALLDSVQRNGKFTSLIEMFIEMKGLRSQWKDKPGMDKVYFVPNANKQQFTRQQDSIMGMVCRELIRDNVTVGQRDKKVTIISIDVKGGDEEFCKLFAERLAANVSEFYIDTKSKKAKNNVAILKRQADSVRYELNSAISGAAYATDNTYNMNPAFLNVKRVPSVRKEIDMEANKAILTELVKNLEIARMALLRDTPLIQIIDIPKYPLPIYKTGRLRSLILGGVIGVCLVSFILLLRRGWKLVAVKYNV
ncbi:MAG: hypothetical protein JO301_11855 [Chitinophagaceae bacterium]|nr:hypothetical protein [Chitinophagaceae bacterium]